MKKQPTHPVDSLTSLVKLFDVSLSANTIGSALLKAGVLREVSYLSTTGSGEEKHFREIPPAFLEFGVNRRTVHEFKTEPRFYAERFPELMIIVMKQLESEILALFSR
ncbi:MAG: hypothetical protein Q8Q50_04785 [Methylobacter sp.]|nr:hypothetical protein [Methylobacter sp.]